MSTYGIDELIISTSRFCTMKPVALADEQYKEMKNLLSAVENSQDEIHAGLRVLGRYVCNSVHDMELDSVELNELSWILRYLTEELESITAVQRNLEFGLNGAYLHSKGMTEFDYLEEKKK